MPLHFFIIPLFRLPCSVPSGIKSPRFALSIPVHLLSFVSPLSFSNPIHVCLNPKKNTKHHAAIVICDTAMMLHTKDL